jgi:hypothetical protein
MASRQFKSTDTSSWTEKYGNGSDGAGSINTSTFGEANETFTGTATQSTGTAGGTSISDNDLVLIHQTQGTNADADPNWEFNKVVSGGGTTGLIFKYALTRTYSTGAQILKLKQYSALTVNTGQTWSTSAWNGSKGGLLAFLCNGTTTITGNIAGTGRGFDPGGTVSAGLGEGCQGAGTTGPASTSGNTAANGNGGGGGGGGGGNKPGAAGGGGGNATAGATGEANEEAGGTGGEAKGNAGLTIMVPGGGGGGGAGDGTTYYGQSGGTGGGMVIIITKILTITGTIATGGNGGTSASDDRAGGGGGGAGGSVLLKFQTGTLGSSLITAAAGAGSGGAGRDGGGGSVGRIHADYLTSFTGTTTPTLDSTQDTTLASGSTGNFLAIL